MGFTQIRVNHVAARQNTFHGDNSVIPTRNLILTLLAEVNYMLIVEETMLERWQIDLTILRYRGHHEMYIKDDRTSLPYLQGQDGKVSTREHRLLSPDTTSANGNAAL